MLHLYLITVCVTLLWVAIFWSMYEGIRYVIKGKRKSKAEREEFRRKLADRRG